MKPVLIFSGYSNISSGNTYVLLYKFSLTLFNFKGLEKGCNIVIKET